MPRDRTAEDMVLAMLARAVAPLACQQIADELGMRRQQVHRVLQRLADRLTVKQGPSCGGKPPLVYALRQPVQERPVGAPPRPHFPDGTIVVTPSNREARVLLHRRDGFVEIEFLDRPRECTSLHERLLRAIQPGRERPAPVAIAT